MAPHVSGAVFGEAKDFEQLGQVEGLHEYDAWRAAREAGDPLQVGDLLESDDGRLRICNTWIRTAEWALPSPSTPRSLSRRPSPPRLRH